MKPTFIVLLALCLCLAGCGKKREDSGPTAEAPNVERTEAVGTSGMDAASKALDEGRYADAVRMYAAELDAEEAKFAPSWKQLSHLNNQLGLALDNAGQYDKALEHFQKSLANVRTECTTHWSCTQEIAGNFQSLPSSLPPSPSPFTIRAHEGSYT